MVRLFPVIWGFFRRLQKHDFRELLSLLIEWGIAVGVPLFAAWIVYQAIENGDQDHLQKEEKVRNPQSGNFLYSAAAGWCTALGLLWFGWTPPHFATLIWLGAILIGGGAGVTALVVASDNGLAEPEKAACQRLTYAGAALCIVSLFVSYMQGLHVPKLSKTATAEEVTEAYRPRCCTIAVQYTAHVQQPQLLWTTVTPQDEFSLGSGVLIANDVEQGLIVTNRHVVDPGMEGTTYSDRIVAVKWPTQSDLAPAHLAAIHRTLDLALIIVEGKYPQRGAIRIIKNSGVRQGEPAVAIGSPQGIELLSSTGIISGRKGEYLTTTCPISPGNSGGPLFLSRYGYLAGINTSQLLESQNLNFAIPAEYVLQSFRGEGHWTWLSHREHCEKLIQYVPLANGN